MKWLVEMHWTGKVLEAVVRLELSCRSYRFLKLWFLEVSFGFKLLLQQAKSVSFALIKS